MNGLGGKAGIIMGAHIIAGGASGICVTGADTTRFAVAARFVGGTLIDSYDGCDGVDGGRVAAAELGVACNVVGFVISVFGRFPRFVFSAAVITVRN